MKQTPYTLDGPVVHYGATCRDACLVCRVMGTAAKLSVFHSVTSRSVCVCVCVCLCVDLLQRAIFVKFSLQITFVI